MAFADKQMVCADCGKSFAFTAAEQEFFASKGYTNDPKRCPACRSSRRATKTGGGGGGSQGPREMFPAVCAQCGQDTQVPFQPRGDKPVYCRDCFNKMKA
jgi:CxxC-x17-CxxC domain-containing protein